MLIADQHGSRWERRQVKRGSRVSEVMFETKGGHMRGQHERILGGRELPYIGDGAVSRQLQDGFERFGRKRTWLDAGTPKPREPLLFANGNELAIDTGGRRRVLIRAADPNDQGARASRCRRPVGTPGIQSSSLHVHGVHQTKIGYWPVDTRARATLKQGVRQPFGALAKILRQEPRVDLRAR
jgi:hypothetical protein